jgi:hypothetical protein
MTTEPTALAAGIESNANQFLRLLASVNGLQRMIFFSAQELRILCTRNKEMER